MTPEIVYSEFAVKCECGHIATFKNVHSEKGKGYTRDCSCGRWVFIQLHDFDYGGADGE